MDDVISLIDDRELWNVWLSPYGLACVLAADDLKLFRALNEVPTGAAELAQKLELNVELLELVLGLLSSIGFLECRNTYFYNTSITKRYLEPTSDFYWGPALRSVGDLSQYKLLREALRRRPSDSAKQHQVPFWDGAAFDNSRARGFAEAMQSHSLSAAVRAAGCQEFASVFRLLDVGGGSGCFSIELAKSFPQLHCTIAELPAMSEVAQKYIDRSGMSARVHTAGLDLFRDKWPANHDAVLMSNVVHDWNADRAVELLRKAYDALPENGRIYIHEMLLGESGAEPHAAVAFSIHMMLTTGGRQRKFSELTNCLSRVGFQHPKLIDTYGYYSLLCAVKS